MTRRTALLAATLAALTLSASFPPSAAASPDKSAPQLEVTYYYLPT